MSDERVFRRDGINSITIHQAEAALQKNIANFKPDTHPILHNQNIALMGICHSLSKIERDLEILHSKLQPVLNLIIDDQQYWQDQVR
jgi:hypothetical protein